MFKNDPLAENRHWNMHGNAMPGAAAAMAVRYLATRERGGGAGAERRRRERGTQGRAGGQRAAALLAKRTNEEKIAQLNRPSCGPPAPAPAPAPPRSVRQVCPDFCAERV